MLVLQYPGGWETPLILPLVKKYPAESIYSSLLGKTGGNSREILPHPFRAPGYGCRAWPAAHADKLKDGEEM